VKDSPSHVHCAWTIQGSDFDIDNIGHNYTQYGQNLNADQYIKMSLMIDPWAYKAMKSNWLNWCHTNPKNCVYSDMVKHITEVEDRLKINRNIIPEWNDQMLEVENGQ
jgi:hypothetical protein